jgi:hypothetical protein
MRAPDISKEQTKRWLAHCPRGKGEDGSEPRIQRAYKSTSNGRYSFIKKLPDLLMRWTTPR